MNNLTRAHLIFFTLSILISFPIFAYSEHPITAAPTSFTFIDPILFDASRPNFFPLLPRATLGAAGTTGSGIGGVEGFLPVYGHPDRMISFVDIEGEYGNDNAFFASPGAGLRYKSNEQIYGAYLFGDYTRTHARGRFIVANPGIEWMTTRWDLHINGYIPNSHRATVHHLGPASLLGNDDFVQFKEHTQFDQTLIKYDAVGNGLDAELGFLFPIDNLRSRIYAGPYHYQASPHISSITGVQAGINYPLNNRASLELAASYDNVFAANAALTLRVSFGSSITRFPANVRERFVDPIPRHLGTLDTAASIPSQTYVKNSGTPIVFNRNIWFFQPGVNTVESVTATECTFEHPCVGINQGIINSIQQQAPEATFYFAPGAYYPVASTLPTPGIFALANGQTFWGRTANYLRPARESNRAIMNGAFELPGDNILDSLQIINNSVQDTLGSYGNNTVGINILEHASGAILLNNLNIAVTDDGNGAFDIFSAGDNILTVNRSTLTAVENNANSINGAENLAIVGNSHITINTSTLNASDNGLGSAFGIFVGTGASVTTINNSTFNTVANGDFGAFNIYIQADDGAVVVNNSTLNSSATNLINIAGATAITITGNGKAQINNSVINAHDVGFGGAFGAKITSPHGSVSINGSTINTVDDGGVGGSAGVVLFGGNTDIRYSTINATQNGISNGGAFGVEILGAGTATISNSFINSVDNGVNGVSAVFVDAGSAVLDNVQMNSTENSSGEANGVFVTHNGSAVINNSKMNIIGNANGLVTGIQANSGSILMQNSNLEVMSNSGQVIGALANGTSNINIANSSFSKISSQTGAASGVENNGSGTIQVTNTNFTIEGNGSSVFNSGAGTVIHTGGTCTVNGAGC